MSAEAALTFAGMFSDGRTAARHDVSVALTTHGLVVSGATIAPVSWPFGDVRVLSSPRLSVMNNQTAILRVTRDIIYFTLTPSTTPID